MMIHVDYETAMGKWKLNADRRVFHDVTFAMISRENRKLFCVGSIVFAVFFAPSVINYTIDNSKPFPLDLNDIGFNGTWDEFCNKTDIWKEFREFPEHDLPRMRSSICTLRNSGRQLNEIELQAIVAYKYCVTMQQNFRDLLIKFTDKLSLGIPDNKHFLLNPRNEANNHTACYKENLPEFHKFCAGELNPCINMFQLVLARACTAPWLTKQNITKYMREACHGIWITDHIDWEAIGRSIKYIQ